MQHLPLIATTLLVCCAVAAPSAAADFHVCDCAADAVPGCQPGSDGSPGYTTSPWQSYEQARTAFAGLSAGDAILFCRGGAWEIDGAGERWINGACRADDRCRVGTYLPSWAATDAPAPILTRLDGDDAFSLADGGTAEHEEGYLFEDLDLRSITRQGSGFFAQNDIDDVLIRNVSITGFRIGVYVAASNACSADPQCDGRNERIVLTDSTVVDNEAFGWLGSSNGSQIRDTWFDLNGTVAIFDHNIYLSNSSGGISTGMRVLGNRLYRSALDSEGVCRAVSLVAHGRHDDLLIEGNEIWEDVGAAAGGCWGIAIDPGISEAESFTNVSIRGNVVRNVGNLAIGVASCQNCLIENNVVIQEQPASSFRSTAIAAPNRARQANDLPLHAVTVRNNSIWFAPEAGGTAILLGGEGTDHLLVSNAIDYPGTELFDCFEADLPTGSYLAVDHNQCHSPAAPTEWVDGVGSLAQWQALTGFDGNSTTADPGFTDPAAFDLSPADAAAGMVDTGHPTLSSPLEIGGFARDAMPDRGAHEWGVDGIFADGFESGDVSAWQWVLP